MGDELLLIIHLGTGISLLLIAVGLLTHLLDHGRK